MAAGTALCVEVTQRLLLAAPRPLTAGPHRGALLCAVPEWQIPGLPQFLQLLLTTPSLPETSSRLSSAVNAQPRCGARITLQTGLLMDRRWHRLPFLCQAPVSALSGKKRKLSLGFTPPVSGDPAGADGEGPRRATSVKVASRDQEEQVTGVFNGS